MTTLTQHPAATITTPLLAGALNAVIALVALLSLGLIASATLGGAAAQVGLRAALVAVIAGGLVYALAGTTAAPAGSPSSATTVIFASLVAELGRDAQLDLATSRDLLALVAVLASAVVLMGLLQVAFGLADLGRLARFVPQPVLAGFMNGVALVILLAQVRPLLGLPPTASLTDPATLARIQPWPLVLGAASAASIWWLTSRAAAPAPTGLARWRQVPAPLLGLGVGLALYAVLAQLLPAADLGRTVGALPQGWVVPDALVPLLGGGPVDAARGLWQRHAAAVLSTAGLLALIGSLESLFSALSLDPLSRRPHDSRRELMALGAANMASGLCGGMPLSLLRSRALTLIQSNAPGRLAVVVAALTFALMFAAGGALLARLPGAVLAGVMVTIAMALIDRWTRQLLRQWRAGERSPELRWSLAIVAVVGAVTLAWGFMAGVAAGVLLATAVFVRGAQRSLLRSRHGADAQPSRRIYRPAQEDWLLQARQRIEVLELEGPLFFGNAARLASECDQLAPGCRFLVLDLRRVTTVDESAAMALQQLSARLAQRGVALLLAAVSADNRHGQRLRAAGCFRESPRIDWWPDADRAIEFAEQRLLAEAGRAETQHAVPLVDTTLLHGLDAAQRARLLALMTERRLQAGERLFSEGDPDDGLYVLTAGSISVVAAAAAKVTGDAAAAVAGEATAPVSGDAGAGQRYVSFSPGMIFGETAMLDGRGRTATALADTPSVVHALGKADFEALCADDPRLGQRLALNIATHLAERLRGAAAAWRASAG